MSNAKIEKRFSVRAAQGEEFVLAGRALTYMEISSNELMPGMRERIMPGAFTKSLASGRDCHCFLNHDGKQIPLGRLQNGSLQLKDNSDFLSFRCQLTRGIQAHEDVYAAVAAGLISECSFAFLPNDEDMSEDEYGGEKCMVRNIKSAQLFERQCRRGTLLWWRCNLGFRPECKRSVAHGNAQETGRCRTRQTREANTTGAYAFRSEGAA